MVATLVHLWRHFWNISCSLQATLLPLLSHFLGTAARLSTFVGRPWSPRCCDNLRTCEVRGINHISPFFDWGLGFSHVRLANATYYYLVLVFGGRLLPASDRVNTSATWANNTNNNMYMLHWIGAHCIGIAFGTLCRTTLAAMLCIPETGRWSLSIYQSSEVNTNIGFRPWFCSELHIMWIQTEPYWVNVKKRK